MMRVRGRQGGEEDRNADGDNRIRDSSTIS
jgi:hypothetical protein